MPADIAWTLQLELARHVCARHFFPPAGNGVPLVQCDISLARDAKVDNSIESVKTSRL